MTPDELRKAVAVMLAKADGAHIQWHDHDDPPDDWSLCLPGDPLAFDWACFDYCVKPETKIVPFDAETVPRAAWVKAKGGTTAYPITAIGPKTVRAGVDMTRTYEEAVAQWVFAATGTPFGSVEGGE